MDITDNGPANTSATAITKTTVGFTIGVFIITKILLKALVYFLRNDTIWVAQDTSLEAYNAQTGIKLTVLFQLFFFDNYQVIR
ncbi:hypothetical protein [Haloarcula sp. Atlit-7R]|uniref:hypothetical protein n=1 Tax=Haloarcula sp. Atlit-7R TaxID=2282125 RepID=UPI001F345798|nr:hypothetical protein [Haloarcula sp. Atlit-7R]